MGLFEPGRTIVAVSVRQRHSNKVYLEHGNVRLIFPAALGMLCGQQEISTLS